MKDAASSLKRFWIWSVVPLVVLAELLMQWWIPHWDPTDKDWKAAVQTVAGIKAPGDLLVIAPDWAVQGRMYFHESMNFKDFGRFDTSTYKRLIEVSIGGAKSPEAQGKTATQSKTFGELSVNVYPLPKPAEAVYSFLDKWRDGIYDKTPKAPPKLIIDHWFHPRQVLQVGLKHRSSITFKDVPLNGVLRGYALIAYREGRFNEGSPIRLRIYLDNKKLGERRIANFSEIKPFEYKLPGQGRGTIKFEVTAKDNKKRQFGIAADIRQTGERP